MAPIIKSSYMLLIIYKGSQKISTSVFLKSPLGESRGEFACVSACTEMVPLFKILGMSQIKILPFLTSHFLLLNCPYSYLNCFFFILWLELHYILKSNKNFSSVPTWKKCRKMCFSSHFWLALIWLSRGKDAAWNIQSLYSESWSLIAVKGEKDSFDLVF